MKRSPPPQRRTPLARRTPLRKQSEKKKKELRETDEIRHAYIEAGLPCECCLMVPATDAHEITAGAHRHRAVCEPNAQLYLCRYCHKLLQGAPYGKQIAIRAGAMLDAVNRCHGSYAVDAKDVIRSLLDYL